MKLCLNGQKHRIAGYQAETMTIAVNDHRHKVRVVKGRGTSRELRCGKAPRWGPKPPQQFAHRPAVLQQALFTSLAMKVVLVPKSMLLVGGCWLHCAVDRLNVVAVDR